MSWWE
ncbi:conserved hypothetical protein, partial [Trichinella spiralis]